MRRIELSRWTGIFVAAVGVLFMLAGVYRGEVLVVWTKAVNICLECIGIG